MFVLWFLLDMEIQGILQKQKEDLLVIELMYNVFNLNAESPLVFRMVGDFWTILMLIVLKNNCKSWHFTLYSLKFFISLIQSPWSFEDHISYFWKYLIAQKQCQTKLFVGRNFRHLRKISSLFLSSKTAWRCKLSWKKFLSPSPSLLSYTALTIRYIVTLRHCH